jgi:hypothetical protein
MQVACTLAAIGNSDRMSVFPMAGPLDLVVLLFMTDLFAMFDEDFALAEVCGSICAQNHTGLS